MSDIVASYQTLQDFDWSMRLVLSSDKLSGLRKPMLQLKLDTINNSAKITENLVELNLDELKSLLSSLKAAQNASQRQ